MAPNRSRASSNANANPSTRSYSPNVTRQAPKQRPRRGSAQAAQSPTSAHARPARTKVEVVPTAPTPEPTGDIGVTMTSEDRYYKNLRVLRRRDPHIVSIFDQFAHVTVYYMQDDVKMERAGYEGTLFFFERDIEPTYGLFILNRQGMHDYIRYLLHDDVFEPSGEVVWISTLDPTKQNAMRDGDKTAGFWAMPMDVRESLTEMMMRLAPYVRRNERYPDEYRYGPDRAVPLQNYFAGGTRDDVKHDFLRDLPEEMREKILQTVENKAKAKAQAKKEAAADVATTSQASLPPAQSNMSELDQLFSKLSVPDTPLPDPTPPASLSGMALLDTMFASVAPPTTESSSMGQKLTLQQLGLAPAVSSPPMNMEILSPKPSAAGLPQILTANVIHELMGLPNPDSRSESRSSASLSTSGFEHPRTPSSAGAPRSKERGYIADFAEDDGASETSTYADLDGSAGVTIMERLLPGMRPAFLSAASTTSAGTLQGDATPRVRPEQLSLVSPPPKPRPGATFTVSEADIHALLGLEAEPAPTAQARKSTAQPTVASRTVSAPSTVPVPFQSGAEIWPGGVSGVASPNGIISEEGDTDEVVELDFSDLGALDDIRTFEEKSPSRARNVKEKGKAKAKANGVVGNGTHAKGPPGSAKQDAISVPTSATKSERVKNGVKSPQATASAVPENAIQDVVGSALRAALAQANLVRPDGQALDRNAFVREVLTLIHTDKTFVDKMYQTYHGVVTNSG